MNKTIYLDNASTTMLDGRVLEKMMPYLTSIYGNANSSHSVGRSAVKGLDQARDTIASLIGADSNEVYFTSGGTEGDNWALRGCSLSRGNKNKIVISSIEHSAMLETCKELEKQGVTVVKIKPQKNGIVSVNDFKNAIDSNTFLVCLMLANNEIGTLQPVKEVFEIAKSFGAVTFADAVQYVPWYNFTVNDLGADIISCSAHKFGGPKGVGFLYVKNGTKITSIITGGYQERARRGGTSNVAGAVGMAEALRLTREELPATVEKVKALRDDFVSKVLKEIPCAKLNGCDKNRLPNNANITFEGVSGEALLFSLDLQGVCASLGAACSAGSIDPSIVLTEIGLTETDAKSTIRFTFGKNNVESDVDYVVETLKNAVNKLKNL
jgi:cysteine desulfurase